MTAIVPESTPDPTRAVQELDAAEAPTATGAPPTRQSPRRRRGRSLFTPSLIVGAGIVTVIVLFGVIGPFLVESTAVSPRTAHGTVHTVRYIAVPWWQHLLVEGEAFLA